MILEYNTYLDLKDPKLPMIHCQAFDENQEQVFEVYRPATRLELDIYLSLTENFRLEDSEVSNFRMNELRK